MWRVEVGGGLVEQQHRRLGGQCSARNVMRSFLQASFIASNIHSTMKYLDI